MKLGWATSCAWHWGRGRAEWLPSIPVLSLLSSPPTEGYPSYEETPGGGLFPDPSLEPDSFCDGGIPRLQKPSGCVPDFLPSTQRALYLRIQQKQQEEERARRQAESCKQDRDHEEGKGREGGWVGGLCSMLGVFFDVLVGPGSPQGDRLAVEPRSSHHSGRVTGGVRIFTLPECGGLLNHHRDCRKLPLIFPTESVGTDLGGRALLWACSPTPIPVKQYLWTVGGSVWSAG